MRMQDALAWTLIHSLWEGAVAALVLFAILTAARSARVRYAASCIALAAVLFSFAGTFVRFVSQSPGTYVASAALPLHPAPDAGPQQETRTLFFHANAVLPWLAPLWITGVLLFHIRAALGWVAAYRLRQRGACGARGPWPEKLTHLAGRLGVSRPVVLLETCLSGVPVVIGHLRPAILIPLGLLTSLSAEQVETILLHELAHIRRMDYLVNLLQVLLESFLFYHPAVWWISGAARAERENCCDDLVVAVNGNAPAYAAALAALEQNRQRRFEPALAANGGSLVKRIYRLLYPQRRERTLLPPALSATGVAVAAACLSFGWQTKPVPPLTPATVEAVQPNNASGLSAPWRKWLNEDVAYIITDEERRAFRALQNDAEHERFAEQFWQRRDPTPLTPDNEMRAEHYRRIGYANEHFSAAGLAGWKTDRGRVYITYGPPDQMESHPPGDALRAMPFESWMYRYLQGIGNKVLIEFEDRERTGEYRMTRDPAAANR